MPGNTAVLLAENRFYCLQLTFSIHPMFIHVKYGNECGDRVMEVSSLLQ